MRNTTILGAVALAAALVSSPLFVAADCGHKHDAADCKAGDCAEKHDAAAEGKAPCADCKAGDCAGKDCADCKAADCAGKDCAECKGADCAAKGEAGCKAADCAAKGGADCKAGDCAGKSGGDCKAGAAHDAALTAKPGEKLYVLGIEGMSCPENCAPKVKESLESIDGVRNVEVSFEDKRAIVTTATDVELSTSDFDKSFKNQGYFVSSLEKVPAK